ncbi:hypothetical protein IFM89_021260 [Coptis chinensis]|uniref:Reverse transcriptase zinc-binding domain-containing protein n=1 Tax=Coptis chinensis TaxID=261450 RepID=A0A835M0A6_9MAGN|nr:hypothetical protein IFM89_021260 [Coptis chinensis]
MKTPSSCSWVWRGILKHRNIARNHIKYIVAYGTNILFWHDPWCSSKPLWDIPKARNLIHLNEAATVSEVLVQGAWSTAITSLPEGHIKNLILGTEVNGYLEKDEVVWVPSTSGGFIVKLAYPVLRKEYTKVKWYRVVWGKLSVPKHSFTLWQLLSNCLPMQDRLIQKKMLQHSVCSLCNASSEHSKHLFFDCQYSKQVWEQVKNRLKIGGSVKGSTTKWYDIFRLYRINSISVDIYKACIGATVHKIWCERNRQKKKNLKLSAQQLSSKIMGYMQIYFQKNLADVKESTSLRIVAARLRLELNFKEPFPQWIKWELAAADSYMLNTDGSVQENGNGFGGVIRDIMGNVSLAYAGSSSKPSVIYQELFAIAKGLQHTKEKGIINLEVNSDSAGAINII